MFKKNISVSSTHQLSGKDGKELRRSVLKAFPSVSEEELAALLPSKAGLVQTKLSNRCLLYSLDGSNPLFFDPDGRGGLLPTVYSLAVLPNLLPQLHTWSEVSGKVLGGSDLFLQGVLAPQGGLPDFLAGSPRALCVPGQPIPFAVGKMAVSRTEALREGMKGRGWTLLHCYGDLLWQLGDKAPPNEGFTPTRIFPLASAEAAGEAPAPPIDGSSEAGEAAEAAEQLGALQLGAGEAAAGGGGSGGGAAPAAAGEAASAADMDALVEAAVLAGLRELKSADLPMQAGDFYTRCMKPAAGPGAILDLKASKYKKLSKLLDKFEKDGVLKQKVVRKQDCIAAVDRAHPAYTGFAGMPGGGGGGSGNDGSGNGASSSGRGGSAGGGGARVEVSYCYRAPSSLRPVFGEEGARDKERLYSEAEVAAALSAYAAAQGLASPDGKTIRVDHLLGGLLFNKKEAEGEGSVVPAGPLTKRLLTKLQLHHRLVRPGEQGPVEVVRKGLVKPVVVSAERRRGHNITAVSHVESFALAPDEVASTFQRKFQTSCSVSKLPGKEEKDHEIMLQGDLAKQVAAFMSELWGIPRELMEVKGGKGK